MSSKKTSVTSSPTPRSEKTRMNRSTIRKTTSSKEKSIPRDLSFGERVARLEVLRHLEALLAAAHDQICNIGWGTDISPQGQILEPNGTRVCPLEAAVDMAFERMVEVLRTVEQEIEAVEGAPAGDVRERYVAVSSDGADKSLGGHTMAKGDISRLVSEAVAAEFARRDKLKGKTQDAKAGL